MVIQHDQNRFKKYIKHVYKYKTRNKTLEHISFAAYKSSHFADLTGRKRCVNIKR